MPVPQSKSELLEAITTAYDKLAPELRTVPPALTSAATMPGHAKDTMMSPHDLAAYLLGWNELVLKWLARADAGEHVDFPETGFKWNELGRLAQKFYADSAALPYDAVLSQLETAKAAIVAAIDARSDDALYGHPWYEKWTMGRMIQFNTSSPYANARSRLRKWKKAQGIG